MSVTDGNGMPNAARKPVVGRERVAKFIATFRNLFWRDATAKWVEMNGEPSVVFLQDRAIIALAAIFGVGGWDLPDPVVQAPGKLAAVALAEPLNLYTQQNGPELAWVLLVVQ